MVDAIKKSPPPTQPLPPAQPAAPAAPVAPAAKPRPAAKGDSDTVSPEAKAKAEKASHALAVLGGVKVVDTKDGKRVETTPEAESPGAPTPTLLSGGSKQTATWSSKAQQHKDKGVVLRNRQAENAKLASLGPEKTEQYNRVRDAIKHDPTAEKELQSMLLNDKQPSLTGGKDLNGGKDLLGHLDQIATQQPGPSVKPKELLRTLTRELANPNAISQGDGSIGTCVATTATIAAAHSNPAEVARLVAGLAGEEGRVELHKAAGEEQAPVLERSANWNAAVKDGFGGDRSQSVRLLQPALMNYAMQTALDANADKIKQETGVDVKDVKVTFDPRTDSFTPTGGSNKDANGGIEADVWKKLNAGGLDTEQGNLLLEHMTGRPHTKLEMTPTTDRKEVLATLKDAVATRGMVPIGVEYVDPDTPDEKGQPFKGGHQMMIHSFTDTHVQVIDPIEGTRHNWTHERLMGALTDANLPGAKK